MAWTVAFALLGALIFSMVVAPVLSSLLFRRNAREWRNPVLAWLTRGYRTMVRWAIGARWLTVGLAVVCLAVATWLAASGIIRVGISAAFWMKSHLSALARWRRPAPQPCRRLRRTQ